MTRAGMEYQIWLVKSAPYGPDQRDTYLAGFDRSIELIEEIANDEWGDSADAFLERIRKLNN